MSRNDASALGEVPKVGITLRVMEFPHAEREVYFTASLAPLCFRCQHFLICLLPNPSVKFLRSWCVLTSRYATGNTDLRRSIWNLVIWNLENHGAKYAVLA